MGSDCAVTMMLTLRHLSITPLWTAAAAAWSVNLPSLSLSLSLLSHVDRWLLSVRCPCQSVWQWFCLSLTVLNAILYFISAESVFPSFNADQEGQLPPPPPAPPPRVYIYALHTEKKPGIFSVIITSYDDSLAGLRKSTLTHGTPLVSSVAAWHGPTCVMARGGPRPPV